MTDIRIVYEDEDICVIDKPSGVVVNDSNSTDGDTVQAWLKDKLVVGHQSPAMSEFVKKGGVVHRLDKDASGVMALAKNERSYERLKEQFVNRQVEKSYLALVHGEMKTPEGIVSTPIERNPNKKSRFYVGKDLSRTAITVWKTLRTNGRFSLLEVNILTGRTHQIRVHMKHLGHPIIADPIYGFVKKWRQDLKFCPRLFLHAVRLKFTHPGTGKVIEFNSRLPDDLQRAYEKIGGW